MLIEITHLTRYSYQPHVDNAQHVAYLTPAHNELQQILSHRLDIFPSPDERDCRIDLFGNARTFFSINASHHALSVTAHSTVVTKPRQAVCSAVTWEAAQEHFRYRTHAPHQSATEFTFGSPYVPIHTDFRHYAVGSFSAGSSLIECAFHLMNRIHQDFTYETNSTEVSTTARQALAQKRGVCQDFAHIMVACWRAMGLPARYVSGYLLTHPPEGQPRLIGCDASHAWASLYIPEAVGLEPLRESTGGWLDCDPTNNRTAGEDYVTLATGRDFSDVSPLRGVILGGTSHQLEVQVTVTPQ